MKKLYKYLAIPILISLTGCDFHILIDNPSTENDGFKLDSPDISIDSYGNVSFTKVHHASGYICEINGVEKELDSASSVISLNPNDTIRVKALGTGFYKDSDYSELLTFTPEFVMIDTPMVSVSSLGIVSWEPIANVTFYQYELNGETYKTKDTSVNLTIGDVFQVKALAEDYTLFGFYQDSDYSDTINYNGLVVNLDTPEISISHDGVVSWTAVEHVVWYGYVKNGGHEVLTQDLSLQLEPGDNIKVRSVNNEITSNIATYVSSSYSNTLTYVAKQNAKYTYKDFTSYSVYDIDSIDSLGEAYTLVIPVWFTNSSNFIKESAKETIRNDIQTAFFGTSLETGWNSVKSFYETESFGKFTFNGEVTEWYECNMSTSRMNESRVNSLVESAVAWFKQNNPNVDMKKFDKDGNGYIDDVSLIYASPDYSVASSLNNCMWAYCNWLQNDNGNVNNPQVNSYLWASFDFMYDNDDYYKKTGYMKRYGNGDTRYCNVDAHTFIHETGHLLGLEDYYDYSDSEYSPSGGFSMQDSNIGAHDPYSKFALGWISPYVVSDSATITISPIESSGDAILISDNFNGSPFDEYLLIELYTPTGLNEFDVKHAYENKTIQGPNVSGIRIWHVDARLTDYSDRNGYTNPTGNLFSDPTTGNIVHAMSNSYSGDYASVLGRPYYRYNILQLIRNDTSESYLSKNNLKAKDLFQTGDEFILSKYQKQFVNTNSWNSGRQFDYQISFDKVTEKYATITINKI